MQLVVIAKEPRPGFSKTRLCPPCTADEAAAIAEAALADTLAVVASTSASRHVIALDGATGPWLPGQFFVISQRSGDLGARLAGVFEDCFAVSDEPIVLVGMDTPQLTAALLRRAADYLDNGHEAVLGPAADGGYWLIGLRVARPGVFDNVAMSASTTFVEQHRQLEACGYRVATTDELADVDTAEDAARIADLIPGSRFARAVADAGFARI